MKAVVYHVDPSSDLSVDYGQLLAEPFSRNYLWFTEASSIQIYAPSLWATCSQWLIGGCRETRMGLFTSTGATCNSAGPSQLRGNCIVVNLLQLPNPAFLNTHCSQNHFPINCLHANLHSGSLFRETDLQHFLTLLE